MGAGYTHAKVEKIQDTVNKIQDRVNKIQDAVSRCKMQGNAGSRMRDAGYTQRY